MPSGRSFLTCVAFCALFVLFAGCSGSHAPSGTSPGASKSNLRRPVEVIRAEQKTIIYSVETVGLIEAEGMTDVAAGVKGIVDSVHFREGDEVDPKQPEPLILIDQRSYLSAMKLAEANLQRADATVQLARDRLDRFNRAAQGSSPQEREEARLTLGVAEAEQLAAQANLDIAKHNLSRSQVRAPYKGRINKRMVTPGMYVEDKTIIATMADLSRVRLVGYVPETAAAQVRELIALQEQRRRAATVTLPIGGWLAGRALGAMADAALSSSDVPSGFDPEFTVLAFPDRMFRARIFYLSTVADPSTHMFECKAEIAQLQGAELKPGYTARVRLPMRSNPHACVVPEECVRATERGFVVFEPVAQKQTDGSTVFIARARPIEIGYRTPGQVEIRGGILPGQVVVRRGAEPLEDGMAVAPINRK
jgi:membrane fusion protein, multidrug efflux system